MRPAQVLITGADGFVGRALVHGFVQLGWQVIALDLEPSDPLSTAEPGVPTQNSVNLQAERLVRWVRADLSAGVPDNLPRADLVIHAAWVTTSPEQLGVSDLAYMRLNLDPLEAVVRHAAECRPDAFVFLSSSGVFQHGDATHSLLDSHTPSATHPYAVAKRAAEQLVPTALNKHTRVHVVRLGYLFGPDECLRPSRRALSPVAEWIAAARAGEPLVVRTDNPQRDWTYTPDLVPALVRLVDGGTLPGPMHLTSGHVCRDQTLAAEVAAAAGGVPIVSIRPSAPLKPPMAPSQVAALEGFSWTEPRVGLGHLLAGLRGAA